MRFKFESAGLEPLGEGDEKKVFVDPENEKRVISERKDTTEKDTPRQLKGRYYLTKIAHLLLPKNVPDIYQAGESEDGKQTIDAERISHSPGQTLLQELRHEGKDEKTAEEELRKELGPEMGAVDLELERIGVLGFTPDLNLGNYTKDKSGNVYYLETFKPWEVDAADSKKLEILFDEEALRDAIDAIPDQKAKEECAQYLERLLALLEEEKKNIKESQENPEAIALDCRPIIEKLEPMFDSILTEENLIYLNSIKTMQEALSDEGRTHAKNFRTLLFSQLKFLQEKTNITAEEHERLYGKYKILDRAVGTINSGLVDHDR